MSAATQLEIYMGDIAAHVGTLYFDARGGREVSTFRYSSEWRRSGFAIAPSIRLEQETHFFSKGTGAHTSPFPGPIADTCPDDWGRQIIIRDRARDGKRATEMDFLVGVDDLTRQGAIRVAAKGGDFVRSRDAGRPITPPLLELAELMRSAHNVENRTETSKDLDRLRGVGSSLGGARPKCSVVDDVGTLFLAKFPSNRDTLPVEKAEVLALRLASFCSLNAAQCQLVNVPKAEPVAIIRRFDRERDRRIPYISAQTMLDLPADVPATYPLLAESIRTHGADIAANLTELFYRVAFTILIRNVDDHLRNHGFLHVNNGRWVLAPMFDVNPAPERMPQLKTWISEAAGTTPSISALLDTSAEYGLDRVDAESQVGWMARTISDRWRDMASGLGFSSSEIEAYGPAYEHAESHIACELGSAASSLRDETEQGPAPSL